MHTSEEYLHANKHLSLNLTMNPCFGLQIRSSILIDALFIIFDSMQLKSKTLRM